MEAEVRGQQAWKRGKSAVFYQGRTGCEVLVESAPRAPGRFPEERILSLGDPECGLGCPQG